MSPIQHERNQSAHKHATMFYSSDGTCKIVFEGIEYSSEAFNIAFPIDTVQVRPDNPYSKGLNSDRTKSWYCEN